MTNRCGASYAFQNEAVLTGLASPLGEKIMLSQLFSMPVCKSETSSSAPFKLLAYLIDGNDPLKADPQLIEAVFNEEHSPDAYRTGQLQLGNYLFDFKPFLTEFLVKTKSKGHNKVYAFSVDWVIRTTTNPDDILEINRLN